MAEPLATQTITAITPEIHKVTPISGFVTIFGVSVNPMVIALSVVLASFLILVWQGTKKNNFNIWDLFQDIKIDGTRVASGIKSTFQVSFLISTWVIVDQEIKGILSEAVFGLYCGTWSASLIAKVVFERVDPPKIPSIASDPHQ